MCATSQTRGSDERMHTNFRREIDVVLCLLQETEASAPPASVLLEMWQERRDQQSRCEVSGTEQKGLCVCGRERRGREGGREGEKIEIRNYQTAKPHASRNLVSTAAGLAVTEGLLGPERKDCWGRREGLLVAEYHLLREAYLHSLLFSSQSRTPCCNE